LKYGLTVHNVLRVRMVTIEGDVVELGNEALDAPGFDLLAVFIGSEGMLGVVTEVTVKLVPKPQAARVIMASFDDVVKGGNAVANVIAAGIIPAGLEMMDKTSSRMVEPFVKAGYDTDAEAIDTVKRFLSYLPSNCNEAPPVLEASKVAAHDQGRLLEILPELRTKVYDARKLAEVIVDVDSLFEMKPKFGRSIMTALARIDGRTVGIIANNPMFKGGAIDVDACNKATSFLVFCDSFNVPIILMVDQPGFLIGLEGEKRGAAGKIINWMNALALVTVPKLSIIVRKSYGQAYLNMGGGRNSDEVAAWPTADLGFMDPKVGASVLAREGESSEATKSKSDSLVRDTTAWGLASLYEAHTVLDPRETRGWLAAMLDVHRSKLTRGVGQHRLANWPTSY
jgi:acetyl-CoA carboxylase carboxyltransferase component